MSLKTCKWGLLPVLAVVFVLVAARPAAATTLGWGDSPEAPPFSPGNGYISTPGDLNAKNVDFNGNPTTQDNSFFTAEIGLDPGSQLTVQGNFQIHADVSVLLTHFTGDGSLPIPFQNPTLSAPTTTVNTTPTGGATLALWNEQNATHLGDIGGDGGNPNNAANLPSKLTLADMNGFNATLIGKSGAAIGSAPININSSGGNIALHTILGDVNLSLAAALSATASANLHDLAFTQTAPGDILSGTGTQVGFLTPAPGPQNASRLYSMDVSQNTGDLSATADLGVNGSASLTLAGIGVGSFPISLANQSTSFTTAFPLPGAVHLLDLNPTAYNHVGDDLQATVGADLSGVPLNLGINSSIVTIVTFSGTISTTFGLQLTFTITGTITLGLLASVVANNVGYQLQDTVLGVVAPEPGSIVLLFVGLVGALPLIVKRYRKKA